MFGSRAIRTGLWVTSAVVLVAGCGTERGVAAPAGTSSRSSIASQVPSAYDPCTDIPESVLASEKLHSKRTPTNRKSGGVRWRGCAWVRTNGYAVSIRATNLTVDVVRSKGFAETRDFTIDGRRAVSTRQFDGPYIQEACTVNVEMNGGSLEFNLNNPPSNRDTGSIDSCELARTLAEKVVPTMPATA